MAARHFDRERVGQLLYLRSRTTGERRTGSCCGGSDDDRDWFNTARTGSGNGGHDVWPRIRTDANRRALIEYLKTL